MREIRIYVPDYLTQEMFEYIADCWAAFATEDLGLDSNESVIVLPDIEKNVS